ncbi:transporter substrate-binding domain-containing protein [Magnetococcales bacterium HHB-1]
MAALDDGHLRAFAADTPTGIFHLQRYGLAGDYAFPDSQFLYNNNWFVAVGEGKKKLLDTINQGMAQISDDERRQIKRRWISGGVDSSDDALIISMDRSYPPFTFLNAQAKPTGLLVDLWRAWSQRTGRKIRFQASSWADTLEMVRGGESDVHSGLFYNQKRAQWLDFSQPIYRASTNLFTSPSRRNIRGLDDLLGKPVGVVAGSYQEAWLKEHYPGIHARSMTSEELLIHALRNGIVHAFLGEDPTIDNLVTGLGMQGEIQTIGAALFHNDIRVGTLKGNKTLLNTINRGFKSLPQEMVLALEKRWIPNAEQRYFERRRFVRKLKLTEEERQWLAEHPVIRVGIDPGYPPFEFLDKMGVYSGLGSEYLDLLASLLGIEFQIADN